MKSFDLLKAVLHENDVDNQGIIRLTPVFGCDTIEDAIEAMFGKFLPLESEYDAVELNQVYFYTYVNPLNQDHPVSGIIKTEDGDYIFLYVIEDSDC